MRTAKYHINKLLLSLEYLYGISNPRCIPTEIFLEPTTMCNLECPACPTGNSLQIIREKAALDNYQEIFSSYSQYLDKWYLYNWGEPLLHKELNKILHILGDGSFAIHMSSNFSVNISPETLHAIANCKNLNLRIDIDGMTQEIHEMYRKKSNLAKIKENCEALSTIIKKTSLYNRANIWIGSLRFKHNQDDLHQIKAYAKTLGFSHKIYDEPLTKGQPPITDESSILYNQGYGCTWLYSTLTVSPSATKLAPCCGTWHPSNFQKVAGELENIHEIWSQNEIMNIRREQSYKRRSMNQKEFKDWQVQNSKTEDSMALNQGKAIGDICSNCTMGNAYQKDLVLIIDKAISSASKILNAPSQSNYRKLLSIAKSDSSKKNDIKSLLIQSTQKIQSSVKNRSIKEYKPFLELIETVLI